MSVPLLSPLDPIALSLLVLTAGGVATLALGRGSVRARYVALAFSLAPVVITTWMWLSLRPGEGFAYFFDHPWIRSETLNVSITYGVDGISMPLVWLTALLVPLCVVFSWSVDHRPAEFHALLLFEGVAVMGTFVMLDLLVFYVFWEVVLIPMYFLIAVWGGPNRKYAAIKFFVYTFLASLLMLVGFIAVYFGSGANTFSIPELIRLNAAFLPEFQTLAFGLLFFGFIVKMPVVPFHTWLPDAHVEAPTAGSVLLAAVLLKMGSYGIIRIALPILPEGARVWIPVMLVLAIVSILYAAFICLQQRDLKKMIAYSSVSHMGVVLLGIAAFSQLGIVGAVWMMFAHGLITAILFMVCGVIQHAAGTRIIPDLGGLADRMPHATALMLVGWLASLGLPGMVGFVAELQVFLATWDRFGLLLALPIASIAITAGYMLWSMQRVSFGPLTRRIDTSHLHDSPWYEIVPMALLVVLVVMFGMFPSLLQQHLSPSVESVVAAMGVA